jgi:putative endonuclease
MNTLSEFQTKSSNKDMWYFYVLQSSRDHNYFYEGSTNDLRRRLKDHNEGNSPSTKPYRPFRLVYYEAYRSEFAARIRESSVKSSGNVSVPLLRRIKQSLE